MARECRDPHAINVNINQFGRAREDVDEDVMNGIQAAAYSLVARVEKMWDSFCTPEMGWLVELPEYRKLATFGEWIRDSALDEPLMQSIQANIASLKSSLSHFVRGQIIWAVNRQLTFEEDTDANAHRRSETYLQHYISDFGVCIYLPLSEKERLLTTFPYKILGSMSFGVDNPSNRLLDTGGVAAWDVKRNEKAAADHGVHRVWTKTLVKMVFELNQKILMTIESHEFNSGWVPTECFFRRGTRRDNVEVLQTRTMLRVWQRRMTKLPSPLSSRSIYLFDRERRFLLWQPNHTSTILTPRRQSWLHDSTPSTLAFLTILTFKSVPHSSLCTSSQSKSSLTCNFSQTPCSEKTQILILQPLTTLCCA